MYACRSQFDNQSSYSIWQHFSKTNHNSCIGGREQSNQPHQSCEILERGWGMALWGVGAIKKFLPSGRGGIGLVEFGLVGGVTVHLCFLETFHYAPHLGCRSRRSNLPKHCSPSGQLVRRYLMICGRLSSVMVKLSAPLMNACIYAGDGRISLRVSLHMYNFILPEREMS